VAALNENTDAIAGMLRETLDADGMPQENTMQNEDPKGAKAAADQNAADEKRKEEIAASAAENDKTLMLSAIETLKTEVASIKQANADREAREKAAVEAANAKRVDAMVACGQLKDSEKGDALWLLSTDAARFETIYANRKGLGKAVPIGETVAAPETIDVEKATPADLLASEIGTYNFLCANWPKEKALKAILDDRNKQAAKRGATKVG
jgi:hypothetical protein